MSHDTAHLSLKNHSSAPDRPLLDSHYPSRGQYTPRYRGRDPRGRSYFPGQGSYGSPLKLLCQICGRAGHSALKCFHRFDLPHSNPQTTAGVPATTSAMEPFRQVPQSFDPLHSSSQALVTTPSLPPDDAWYLDNGASHHTTPDVTAIDTKATYHGSNKLVVGNGSALPITHIGNSYIPTPRPLQLKNILLVPALKKNLISISQFTLHNNVLVEFDASCCYVKDKVTKDILVQGRLTNGIVPD